VPALFVGLPTFAAEKPPRVPAATAHTASNEPRNAPTAARRRRLYRDLIVVSLLW
jgi:hypothetical protein